MLEKIAWQEEEGEKKRFQYWLNTHSSDEFLYFRAIQGHSGGNLVYPSLQDSALMPDDFTEYIFLIGNAHEMHSSIKSGLIPGGRSVRRDRQSVFFTAVSPAQGKIWEKSKTVWTNPESKCTKILGNLTNIQFFVQFEACSEKGIVILSNSITCNCSFKHTASDLKRESGMHENW